MPFDQDAKLDAERDFREGWVPEEYGRANIYNHLMFRTRCSEKYATEYAATVINLRRIRDEKANQ